MAEDTRRTRRLRLRPVATGDEAVLHTVFTLKDVRRYLWDDEVIPVATTQRIVQGGAEMRARDGTGLWLAFLEDGDLAGFGGFWPFHDQIELLYGLVPAFFGRGLATEMAADMLLLGFGPLDMQRIVGSTDVANRPSIAVMERLGMQHEETKTIDGLDTTFYAIDRQTWLARGAAQASVDPVGP